MTNISRITFTETSLCEALSAVRSLHDMSTEFIAAEVFRQASMDLSADIHHGHDNECQRRHLVDAEGCKPEISIQPGSNSTTMKSAMHGLDKAEGEQPDFNSPIHPDDMPAIVEQHRDFMKLTHLDWMDEASSLQDQAYALGHHRGLTAVIPAASSAGLPDVLPAVAVEGDQLVIRITTECLLHAVTCAPEWPINGDGSPIQVNDGALLVKEIIHELQRENEHGTNQMHRMFDEAAVSALDNGSQAVSYDGEAQEALGKRA